MSTAVYLTRKGQGIVSELCDYDSLKAVLRLNAAGTWSITAPLASADLGPGDGVVVQRDGQDLINGFVTKIDKAVWADGSQVTISGLTNEARLDDRLCYPCEPDWLQASAFAASAYDVRSGPLETVAKETLSRNLRGLPLTIAPDEGRGPQVDVRLRFQSVGEALREIFTGIEGWRFFVDGDELDITARRDRRAEQVFSFESGNVLELGLERECPGASGVVVAGSGEGVERVFARATDEMRSDLWGRSIETFRDARDSDDVIELAQRGEKDLAASAERAEVSLQVVDVQHRQFGRDWQVGDLVSVDGIDAVVREAHVSIDANGEVIAPRVSGEYSPRASAMLRLYDETRRLKQRISLLERTK